MCFLHVNMSGGGIGVYGQALQADLESEFPSKIHGVVSARKVGALYFPFLVVKLFAKVKRKGAVAILDSCGKCSPLAALAARIAAYMAGIKYWCVIHDPMPHQGMGYSSLKEKISKFIEDSCDVAIVHGQCSRDQVLMSFPGKRVVIMPHPNLRNLVTPCDRKARLHPGSLTVLFFGALRPNKGVEMLIPYFRTLKERYPEARMVVAGSASLAPELMNSSWPKKLSNILSELSQEEGVELLNEYIPDEAVDMIVGGADIIILPYKDATQSGVLSLSVTKGLPVVATSVGDMGQVVIENKLGVTTGYDPGELVFATEKVLDEYDSYIRNVISYRKKVDEHKEMKVALQGLLDD